MARRTYGPAGNERKAIISGGVAVCVVTLVLTVTASVMTVKYLNSHADLAFASTVNQYQTGVDPPEQNNVPNGNGQSGGVTGPIESRDPISSESSGNDGSASTPAATDPVVTEPVVTEPAVTEPVVTDSPQDAVEPAQTVVPVEDNSSVEVTSQRPDKLGSRTEPVISKRPSDSTQTEPDITTDPTDPSPPVTDDGNPGEGANDGASTDEPHDTAADGSAGGDGFVEGGSPALGEGSSVTYVVEPGDTLMKIGNRFGVSVDDIVAANQIKDRNKISVGQVLTIPGGKTAANMVSPNTGPED